MSAHRQPSPAATFRERVLRSETLFGTFIKTPTSHGIEIVGALGYDFALLDAEHAPFDRVSLDHCILAARAAGCAPIVRVPTAAPEYLLAALDDGAYGVMVPHVRSAAVARDVVAACRYAGRRGFSNSPRAGGYGARSIREQLDTADGEVLLLAMIEDPEAVDDADAILAVPGIDAVFVGRGDLTAAFDDRAPGTPRVRAATLQVLEAARARGTPAFLLVSDPAEAAEFAVLGVSGFVLASDQGFLRRAASDALRETRATLANPAQDRPR